MDMFTLRKTGFNKDNIISFGNMFLIGNGHLGYRGTLEEYSKNEMVGLNVCGFYDRYQDSWRESINMVNPFKVVIKAEEESYSILDRMPLDHYQELDIKHALFKRHTEFDKLIIDSERFISSTIDNLLVFKYKIKAKTDLSLTLYIGMDDNIFESNGPHFKEKEFDHKNTDVIFKGITNENRKVSLVSRYIFDNPTYSFNDKGFDVFMDLKEGEEKVVYSYALLDETGINDKVDYNESDFESLKSAHFECFEDKWDKSFVRIKGNDRSQFAINYSIYHLLILGSDKHSTSIPARGVSGSVYKGAIFWDTEIFMVPFFTLTNPSIAKNLLKYRIRTLEGAKAKAKEYGYSGAFYAWESQEDGRDACSKYNITDAETGKPVRTYFNEKQIHISADIVYAIEQYMNVSGDYSLLDDGAIDLMNEVSKFFMSYSKEVNGKYHLLDVIGPDEYHERIDDNAFTSYMAKYAMEVNMKYLNDNDPFKNTIKEFLDRFYLPPINQNNLIEQFSGYFDREDIDVEGVRKRIRIKNEYWGGEKGIATPTRVLKQADVIALLVLLNFKFNKDIFKDNFDFYFKYTEHGSSLSSSMYSIIASWIDNPEYSYKMFLKSAEIDLGTDQKTWLGSLYIGGTHPASNAGAYLSLIYGMAGLRFNESGFTLDPHLPQDIEEIEFTVLYKGKKYFISVKDKNYNVIEK